MMDASCGVWWMGSTALGKWDGFFRRPRGGSRGGGPSISVGIEECFLVVDACSRESSQKQLIPKRRVVP